MTAKKAGGGGGGKDPGAGGTGEGVVPGAWYRAGGWCHRMLELEEAFETISGTNFVSRNYTNRTVTGGEFNIWGLLLIPVIQVKQ